MRFSYEWLKNIVGFNQSLNEVVDLLNRYSFDTEPAGKTSIEVKLPPNRIGDASGHLGLAKEVAVVLGKTIDLPKMTYRAASFKTSDFLSVEIKNKNRCPRYLAMYAELNRVGRSPKWMQKRMQDCGLRPINAVVDIMNYVMLEYGQPLHAFDFDKLDRGQAGKKQIIVRLAQKGEMIATIEDKTYKLVGTELLICDSKQPLAIAGIKGGKDAEIDFQTKKIVVEAANFDPIGIRQAARSLGIRTDASARFENGVDPNLAGKAMQRVCALLQEICGAKVAKNGVDIYPVKKLPKKLIVSLTAIEKILGMKVSAKQAETIFKSFCVSSKKLSGGKYQLVIETDRQDISMLEDVAEEVGRIIGYDKIPAETVVEPVVVPVLAADMQMKSAVQDILIKLGFDEVMNYSLIKEQDLSRLEMGGRGVIKVTKPTSGMYEFLHLDLLPGLLHNVADNSRYLGSFRLFELGKFFGKGYRYEGSRGDIIPSEEPGLGLVVYGGDDEKKLFLEIKGYIEALVDVLGVDRRQCNYGVEPYRSYLGTYRAIMDIDKHPYAFFGVLKRATLDFYGIAQPVAYAEIWIGRLWRRRRPRTFIEVPKYPEVKRDLSLFVGQEITVQQVADAIGRAAGTTLRSVDLFDMFHKGKNKSLSFHLRFQSLKRTLTDAEVDNEMKQVMRVLQDKGFIIR